MKRRRLRDYTVQVGAVELPPSRPEATELPISKFGSGPTSLSGNLEKPSFLSPSMETHGETSIAELLPSPPSQSGSPSSLHPSLEPTTSNHLSEERPISLRPSLGAPSSDSHILEQPRRLAPLVSDWSLRAPSVLV